MKESLLPSGTSGSGKSTLLNILGCLDTPTCGEYLLDDIPVTYDEQASTCSTKKPEDWLRVPKLQLVTIKTTAVENVELPLMYNSAVSASERRRRAIESYRL